MKKLLSRTGCQAFLKCRPFCTTAAATRAKKIGYATPGAYCHTIDEISDYA